MTRIQSFRFALVVALLAGPLSAGAAAGTWSSFPFGARWACEDGCDEVDSRSSTSCSSWKCRWDRWCRRSRGIATCHPEAPPICHPTFGYHPTRWRWLPHPPPCPASAATGLPRVEEAPPFLDGAEFERRKSDEPPVPPPAR